MSTHRTMLSFPSLDDLAVARHTFERNEPRDLFYRAATELVELAIQGRTSLTVVEAIAVLLQTWNSTYYRFHGPFDAQHFADIEGVLSQHWQVVASTRQRSIDSLCDGDRVTIEQLFADLEHVLGPVGAAKCLHLLAPRFFPLWDERIAAGYHLNLRKRGENAPRYVDFMQLSKMQSLTLGGEQGLGRNPLKALDEYNYCRYSRAWITPQEGSNSGH